MQDGHGGEHDGLNNPRDEMPHGGDDVILLPPPRVGVRLVGWEGIQFL